MLALLGQREAEAMARLGARQQEEKQQQLSLFLPGMEEHMRAMPNYLSRSPVFAPVTPEKNQRYEGEVLYETELVTLKGWGKQLCEDHADIWLHSMHLASTLGIPAVINRAEFLCALGRNTSGASYRWLHKGITALSTFSIAIEARSKNGETKYSIGYHPRSRLMNMLGGLDYDDKLDEYWLFVDERWRQTFSNQEYGFVDWDKRLQIGRNQDLAKSLQRLVSTSVDTVQRHSLESLKVRARYTSPMRKFRGAVKRAMEELERCEIIAGGRIEHSTKGKEQAVWTKL
ncbi:TrfA [Paraburkholderia sediminicola]|uniref:TrfA n=1 Tax=Paraburkholderia sediminicola TaxID=458836 RepID=UPI0038BC7CFC